MTGYTKLFNSIIGSTIWCQDSDTRIVWVTLLAMANAEGVVEVTIPGLSGLARVPVDKVREAIAYLESPDPDSRTPDNDGRRLTRVNGGLRLLNYQKYRERRDADERRNYMRDYMREYRNRNSNDSNKTVNSGISSVSQKLAAVSHSNPQLAQAEAEAYKPPLPPLTKGGVVNFQSQELKNHPRRCLMPECKGQARAGLPGMASLFCSEACYSYAKHLDPKMQ